MALQSDRSSSSHTMRLSTSPGSCRKLDWWILKTAPRPETPRPPESPRPPEGLNWRPVSCGAPPPSELRLHRSSASIGLPQRCCAPTAGLNPPLIHQPTKPDTPAARLPALPSDAKWMYFLGPPRSGLLHGGPLGHGPVAKIEKPRADSSRGGEHDHGGSPSLLEQPGGGEHDHSGSPSLLEQPGGGEHDHSGSPSLLEQPGGGEHDHSGSPSLLEQPGGGEHDHSGSPSLLEQPGGESSGPGGRSAKDPLGPATFLHLLPPHSL
ncbi:unnamed protein product [Arctogadus glacialis]